MLRDARGLGNMKNIDRLDGKMLVQRIMKIVHFIGAISIFVFCIRCFYNIEEYGNPYNVLVTLFYAVFYILLAHIYKAYDIGYSRVAELVYSHELTGVICGCFTWMYICIAGARVINVLPIIIVLIVQAIWNVVWTLVANKLYYCMYRPKRTAVVFRNDSDLQRLNGMRNYIYKFTVDKYIENPRDYKELLSQLSNYEAIFVVGVNATLRNAIAKYCVENNVSGYFAPHVGDIILSGAAQTQAFGLPMQEVNRKFISPEYRSAKRVFDVITSIIALIMLSPVMLITALLIKLGDGGPVFYKQTRVARDGKLFSILKFRSMRVDAEKDGVARLVSDNDDRITNVGKFIRACRIDELPQLINILNGDMSIVGPRPERPEIAAEYEKVLPTFKLRLQVKAGLTGYAQVYGRYNTEPYDKLQMDLIYINRMSFVEDLRLIFATIKILFLKESTQGIAEGRITAQKPDIKKSA